MSSQLEDEEYIALPEPNNYCSSTNELTQEQKKYISRGSDIYEPVDFQLK